MVHVRVGAGVGRRGSVRKSPRPQADPREQPGLADAPRLPAGDRGPRARGAHPGLADVHSREETGGGGSEFWRIWRGWLDNLGGG